MGTISFNRIVGLEETDPLMRVVFDPAVGAPSSWTWTPRWSEVCTIFEAASKVASEARDSKSINRFLDSAQRVVKSYESHCSL